MATQESYWSETKRPIYALLFLAPLIAVYEAGILYINSAGSPLETRNAADVIIRQLAERAGVLKLLGLTGLDARLVWFALSGLVVIATLIVWQAKTRTPWLIRSSYLGGMWLESLGLGVLPLLVLLVLSKILPVALGNPAPLSQMPTPALLTLSIGAGIFEEFLFRLIGVGLVFVVLHHALDLSRKAAIIGAAVTTALVFAAFHLVGPFGEQFNLVSFVFRSCSGVFFAALLATRGFGVTAGAHAAYDVIVVLLSRTA